ncbi:MAG: hypothetical protein J1E34_07975 [Oscillospiraceae bacterium]|nr:hypothetical protein [Oscillospiraceae bacterium]
MKAGDILDAIGNIDEACVKRAKEKTKSHKPVWIVGCVAACLAVAVFVPFVLFFWGAPQNAAPPDYGVDSAIGKEYVWIYYVDGEEIRRENEWLKLSPEIIFNAWRDKNGLGDEVKFIKVNIDTGGKTAESEFESEKAENNEIGSYRVYNLTITKSIENYYDNINSELLLESLKRTMTEYSGFEYNEYHLMLEE